MFRLSRCEAPWREAGWRREGFEPKGPAVQGRPYREPPRQRRDGARMRSRARYPCPSPKQNPANWRGFVLAEREGFEPSIRFPVYTLSKRAPSATRPPLHPDRQDSRDAAPERLPKGAVRILQNTARRFALAARPCRDSRGRTAASVQICLFTHIVDPSGISAETAKVLHFQQFHAAGRYRGDATGLECRTIPQRCSLS